jgi:hypothetical protein
MSSNIEKEVDFADYEKDDYDEPEEDKTSTKVAVKAVSAKVAKKAADAKEKNFQTALDEKAAKDAAQKEIDDIMEKMSPDQKGRMLAVMGVVAAASTTVSPLSRHTNYDHETKQKNLVKDTAPVRVQMEKLKDDYE